MMIIHKDNILVTFQESSSEGHSLGRNEKKRGSDENKGGGDICDGRMGMKTPAGII